MKLKHGKKSGLKYFNMNDLRSWNPCYDPSKFLKEDFRGTAIDILNNKEVLAQDRIWVVLRTSIVSEKLMRLFAVWAVRQVQHLMSDSRSLKALDVAESFAIGSATQEELSSAAASAAYSAAASASAASKEALVQKLIEMVKIEGKERIYRSSGNTEGDNKSGGK